MSPRTGRPTNNPKKHHVGYRLSEDDVDKLHHCAEVLNISATEVIRLGIDMLHSALQEDSKKGSDNTENRTNK